MTEVETKATPRIGVVDLGRFDSSKFDRGASRVKEALWLLIDLAVFRTLPFSLSKFKCWLLRVFGAEVGRGVVIKPNVRIKFPWRLHVGSHVWVGEEAYLLNLAPIVLDDHVCISQRAFLCTGNHDYSGSHFDLMTAPIRVEQGAWIGAGAFVGPGVTVYSHAVLTACSVATRDLEGYAIWQGNPAVKIRTRVIQDQG